MKIIFPIKTYQKFRAYIENCDEEISGLGKISKNNNIITIEDIKIFNQTATAAETVLDKKDLGKFYDEIIQRGENISDWKLWFHSHANMNAFFSSIDLETIEDFDNDLPDNNWMLSIVSNHEGDLLARIDIFEPIRCTMNKIDWEIDFKNETIEQEAIIDIMQKVNPKVIIIPPKKNSLSRGKFEWINGKLIMVNPHNGELF